MFKKEYEIMVPFIKEPWNGFTFNNIMKESKKKSKSYVYAILKKMVKQKIFTEKKTGNVINYSLNIKNTNALNLIGAVAEHIAWKEKQIPFEELENIMAKIPTKLFICIITGSYARNQQKKESDMDVVIITDNALDPKKVYSEIRSACELTIPSIHPYVFREKEFKDMLINKQANYGKEVAHNNLIIYGGNQYYNIMAEAISYGFAG